MTKSGCGKTESAGHYETNRTHQEPPAMAVGGSVADALQPLPNAAQYCVLVVDDDAVNRLVLSGMLALHRYRIIEAASGQEALAMLRQQRRAVDLVILDVMMPRMSGFEVCSQLRQRYPQEELPIVFLTAKHGDEDVARGLQVGGNEVLYKPVRKEVLLPRIIHYLTQLAAFRAGA